MIAYATHAGRWSTIARTLTARTDNQVKTRWRSLCKTKRCQQFLQVLQKKGCQAAVQSLGSDSAAAAAPIPAAAAAAAATQVR